MNSQLMEAIQQKIELSQQLEEWKTDMEVLLEDQIKERLLESERRKRDLAQQEHPNGNVGTKLLSFFHRN